MERLERADWQGMRGPRRADPQCSRRVILEITIPCSSREKCEAVYRAIKPDDATAPPWMRIREYVEDAQLRVVIEAPVSRIMSARATADELIEYSYSLLRSLELVSGPTGGSDEKRSPSRDGED